MKKLVTLLLAILLTFVSIPVVFATAEKPDISSKAAILMDNQTEKILYAKCENEKMYPASTTKIMTAILTLENCKLDEVVTISYDAVMSIPEGYSSAFLQVGEQLTIEQLLQLLLVHSANDAANVLAKYVGGSIESFVSMMNTKVHELKLSNTHFTNTYGMHDDNHFTTAQDLAFIMKYCMKNEDFRKIAGSASCAIPATNKYDTRRYSSTNELIIPNSPNYYPYLTAGKTGFTTQAGDCLVSCAYQGNLELICVILGGKTVNGVSTRFSETKTLYNYGFHNYSIKTLFNSNDFVTQIEVQNATKETRNLEVVAKDSIYALLENSFDIKNLTPDIKWNETIQAPIEQGSVLGTISYTIDNIQYETDLVASHYVEESQFLSSVLKIGIGILFVILAYTLLFHKKRKK